ncbi:MAG: DinB family protein [Planctomycetota bacterium]|jgi:uncharacterized damage-inducible protein DinB
MVTTEIFRLDEAIDRLTRTPGVLRDTLEHAPDEWTRADYGPRTFSAFDVVAHLIHGELTDWLPRARHILEHGPDVPFEPFDIAGHAEVSRGKTMAQLLDEFQTLRAENIEALQSLHLTEEQLALPGTHPALGPVTMQQLLATWVVHDLHHIAQIQKALAFHYRDEMGPWIKYQTIMRRPII